PFALDALRYAEHGGAWSAPTHLAQNTPLRRLRLRFLTPTRLLVHKELDQAPSFRTLALKAARRVLEVAHFHVPGARVDWDLEALLGRAEAITTHADDLRWIHLERYSNRQRRKLDAGGLVGTVALDGDLTPFLPLLTAAETLHIGKGTTYGLGRVAVEAV
ncbi:MAG: CRISPR system precrRNA processing endoribonuclease RAMP protein Cas6, partial [Acidobacteria bacterium]|nr:CRISPR system precrRNA processing endoribonuclease RAMP protein Cas6 [Acidobacteriota bacterium]